MKPPTRPTRREDDEATVDLVGIKILVVAEFLGHLRREAGAVDVEGRELGWRQPERDKRLVVTFDEMRLADRQQPAIDQLVVAQAVDHYAFSPFTGRRCPKGR